MKSVLTEPFKPAMGATLGASVPSPMRLRYCLQARYGIYSTAGPTPTKHHQIGTPLPQSLPPIIRNQPATSLPKPAPPIHFPNSPKTPTGATHFLQNSTAHPKQQSPFACCIRCSHRVYIVRPTIKHGSRLCEDASRNWCEIFCGTARCSSTADGESASDSSSAWRFPCGHGFRGSLSSSLTDR